MIYFYIFVFISLWFCQKFLSIISWVSLKYERRPSPVLPPITILLSLISLDMLSTDAILSSCWRLFCRFYAWVFSASASAIKPLILNFAYSSLALAAENMLFLLASVSIFLASEYARASAMSYSACFLALYSACSLMAYAWMILMDWVFFADIIFSCYSVSLCTLNFCR